MHGSVLPERRPTLQLRSPQLLIERRGFLGRSWTRAHIGGLLLAAVGGTRACDTGQSLDVLLVIGICSSERQVLGWLLYQRETVICDKEG